MMEKKLRKLFWVILRVKDEKWMLFGWYRLYNWKNIFLNEFIFLFIMIFILYRFIIGDGYVEFLLYFMWFFIVIFILINFFSNGVL